MKIDYQIKNNEIEIIRCYGNDPKIVLPEQIDGLPVTKAAPYAFSDHKETEQEEVLSYETEEGSIFAGERGLLAGTAVEEVIFPSALREIGNYIFYGCKSLRLLEFSNTLQQIGSGAFTGCGALSRLKVHMTEGDRSCTREILEDLWQRIDVTFFYEQEKKRAVLVFPEHYEEAVENTPARILFTQHHGSGNNYRQCFYNKEMDYRKYDSLFSVAAAWDKIEVLADIAFGRLRCPYQLTENDRQVYRNLIRERFQETIKYLIEQELFHNIRVISTEGLWSREMLEYALELASKQGKMEILSYLMNEKQKNFRQETKKFIL